MSSESEHVYPATVDGQPVHVLLSWDFSLQGFLLVVQWDEAAAEQEQGGEHTLFAHWTSCTAFYKGDFAGARVYITQALAKLGLVPIESVMQAIKHDSERDEPRRIVWYDEAGQPVDKNTNAVSHRRRSSD